MNNLRKFAILPVFIGSALYAGEKPNILWLTIEDTSPHFIGCYGNKDARTPVIDKLAAEGVRFTNAFSTGTVCSPSRTCIITGVKTYRTGTGNHRSNYPVPSYIKGFPYYMQQAGYYTTNNNKTDYNVADPGRFTKEAWDESSGKAGWWNRKSGQPFFAVFNFNDSHQSRTMTNPFPVYQKTVLEHLSEGERIGDQAFDMPPFYRDSPEMRKQFARVYNSLKLTDNKLGEILARLEKEGLKDSTIIFFFGDHGEGIPRGKTNGINLGHRVPFVIWFPEMYKHLSPWGTGVVTEELVDFNDLAPTLIRLAGGNVPEHMAGRVLMGTNRSKPASHLVLSSDRSDNGIDMIRSVTDGKFFYARNYMPYMPEARYIRYMEIGEIKQQMRIDLAGNLLNPLQKSLFDDRPAEFLFDVENDPWETRNLATDPKYITLLEKMRGQLKDEVLQSRDILFLPEYEIDQLSKHTTAYEFRLQKEEYPVENIYEAASLSGFRGKEVTRKQVALLKDPNNIVRYWAALGLLCQASSDLQPWSGAISQAMQDPYPPVAVTVSAIAYRTSGDKKAEVALKKYCTSDQQNLALMTVNYLLYVQDKQPFIETVRAVHEMEGRTYNVKVACMDFLGSLGLAPKEQETGD